jgi:hypothetical protein
MARGAQKTCMSRSTRRMRLSGIKALWVWVTGPEYQSKTRVKAPVTERVG